MPDPNLQGLSTTLDCINLLWLLQISLTVFTRYKILVQPGNPCWVGDPGTRRRLLRSTGLCANAECAAAGLARSAAGHGTAVCPFHSICAAGSARPTQPTDLQVRVAMWTVKSTVGQRDGAQGPEMPTWRRARECKLLWAVHHEQDLQRWVLTAFQGSRKQATRAILPGNPVANLWYTSATFKLIHRQSIPCCKGKRISLDTNSWSKDKTMIVHCADRKASAGSWLPHASNICGSAWMLCVRWATHMMASLMPRRSRALQSCLTSSVSLLPLIPPG